MGGPMSDQTEDEDRRAPGWWSSRGRWILVGVLLLLAAGAGGWLLRSDDGEDVLFEAAESVGPDPFTLEGVAADGAAGGPTTTDALYGGSGKIGVCDPDRLVKFLEQHPDKAKAWTNALNAFPDLMWSGGNKVMVSQIAAYVAELTPGFLSADTEVINNGFDKVTGKATPRKAILGKGTAVLSDANGVPRVRCKCGNPLGDDEDEDPTTTTAEVTTTVESTSTTTDEGTTSTSNPDDNPDDCDVDSVGPVSSTATDITTAPVDFDGDGVNDVLRIYQQGGAWHVRAEIGGTAIDDDIVVGAGPMTAIGGAMVNNDSSEEAWVKTSAMGASTDTIGLFVFRDCDLQRVLMNATDPAEFPIGASTMHADGLQCFGFGVGIEVFTTTSTDGITYKGTSKIYTIDLSGTNPVLTLGATASQTESDPPGGPTFEALSKFSCGSLSNIP